ncbi:hypothetical protein ACLKA6_010214 [Drosophila palustris]
MESDEDSQHEDKTVIEEDVNTKMLRLIMEQMAVLTNKTVDLASQSERVANITQDLAIRVGNLEQPTIMGAHGFVTQDGSGVDTQGSNSHEIAISQGAQGVVGSATQVAQALDKMVIMVWIAAHIRWAEMDAYLVEAFLELVVLLNFLHLKA